MIFLHYLRSIPRGGEDEWQEGSKSLKHRL